VSEEFMLLDAESFDRVQRLEAFLRSEQRAIRVAVDDPDRAIRIIGALKAHFASWSRCRPVPRSDVASRPASPPADTGSSWLSRGALRDSLTRKR